MHTRHFFFSRHPRRRTSQRGQTLVEYALIVAFIAVVAIGVLLATSSQISGTFNTVETQLDTAKQGQAAAVPPSGGGHS